jgi:DNA-directed RNA polymerase specialized sigma24 family protein
LVVAEALDGRLNIMSRRAADRLANADRQRSKKAQSELREALHDTLHSPHDIAVNRIGLDRVSASRRGEALRAALEAQGEDATQAQLAAFIGVTARTIRNWQSEVREETEM